MTLMNASNTRTRLPHMVQYCLCDLKAGTQPLHTGGKRSAKIVQSPSF